METARVILAGAMGGCFGFSIVQLFRGNLNIGLGVLAIGILLAICYLACCIVDR
jgi:hypothetical protein